MARWLCLVLILLATLGTSAPLRAGSVVTENAGADGAVLGVVCRSGVAGAVLWPLPAMIETPALHGGMAVAARALLNQTLASYPQAEPILLPTSHGLAVGAELPSGSEVQLLDILSQLAAAADPSPEVAGAALGQARQRAIARASDPLEQARLAALSSLFPGPAAPWLTEGTQHTLAEVEIEQIYRVLESVRASGIGARVCGPPGLAGRVAQRLGGRLVRLPPRVLEAATPSQSAGVVVYDEFSSNSPQAALVLAARIGPDQADQLGASLSLLMEVLREGEGSLAQRLGVGVDFGGEVWLETIWLPGTGGVVVLGTRVNEPEVDAAWSLISGTVSSIQNQLFRRDAVLRARQRLDRRSKTLLEDAGAMLEVFGLEQTPWAWPPQDRWKAPIGAGKLRQAAVALFASGRHEALAGSSRLRHASGPFSKWQRLPGGAFCPGEENLHCSSRLAIALGRAGDVGSLARRGLQALGVKAGSRQGQAFRALYRVREMTPGGSLELELEIESSEKRAAVSWSGSDWSLAAVSGDGGDELLVNDERAREVPRAALDRVEAYASREPVVFLSAVAAGLLTAQASIADCPEEAGCPAIRAEMPEGSTLVLVLDPQTGLPIETRCWWSAAETGGEADEVHRIQAWREIEGIRVASQWTVLPHAGAEQHFELLRWQWQVPASD